MTATTTPKPPNVGDKPRIQDTAFFQLHRILDSRRADRALRVDRKILEGVMAEIISAAKRVEKLQEAAIALSPALDFTDTDSPQDTVLSLLSECRGVLVETADETGLFDNLRTRRKELAERITEVIGE